MSLERFVVENEAELVKRARAKVASRRPGEVTAEELEVGVPLFLKQLVSILRNPPIPGGHERAVDDGATQHGRVLLRIGLNVEQVVHAYGDVCQAITELAIETHVQLETEDFKTLNRCLDDAIAAAVTEFVRLNDVQNTSAQSALETERLAVFAHELRNLLNTAGLAFGILKSGAVGVAGTTGRVLEQTLAALRELVNRSLSDVRLTARHQYRTRFRAAAFIEEVELAASLEPKRLGRKLVVQRVTFDWFIEGDRQLLGAAMANLIQNAFKYTRADTTVQLRTNVAGGRIVFEVEDECGGLSAEKIERIFRPFEQGSEDRSGMGLGLGISRRAVEADGGTLTAKDVAGRGCIFRVELPLLGRTGDTALSSDT